VDVDRARADVEIDARQVNDKMTERNKVKNSTRDLLDARDENLSPLCKTFCQLKFSSRASWQNVLQRGVLFCL
jgi:hypothetical protein